MILGTGIDILDLDRMRETLGRRGEKFAERVFTERERAEISERSGDAQVMRAAGKFAAKEALLKALGTGLADGISWTEIEVLSGAEGAPAIQLTGRAGEIAGELGADRIHVSISHSQTSAAAIVILEGR